VILLIGALWRGSNGVSIGRARSGLGGWRPEFGVARDVLRIGVPAAMEQILIASAFFVLTIIVARLGTETLAAHRLALNALALSSLPGIGLAIATTAFVAQRLAARPIGEAPPPPRLP